LLLDCLSAVIQIGPVRRQILAFGLALGISVLPGCGKKPQSESGAPGSAPARLRIAVIPKGTTHEFWKSVHAGAAKAARELDVDIV
jgi:ribose transport system substrate-binding protein